MLRWLLRRRIAAFRRTWGYDTSYMEEILATSLPAATRFAAAQRFANHREELPAEAGFAAGLVTLMSEDCGPCVQLVVKMAEAAGIDSAVLHAILARDVAHMSEDARLAFRFAEATLRHNPEADALREEIERRWGKRALVSLAFAIAGSRIYPTLKYALGHGQACTRVRVGDREMPVLRLAA